MNIKIRARHGALEKLARADTRVEYVLESLKARIDKYRKAKIA